MDFVVSPSLYFLTTVKFIYIFDYKYFILSLDVMYNIIVTDDQQDATI